METVLNVVVNQCSKCEKIFPSRNKLFKHIAECISGEDKESYNKVAEEGPRKRERIEDEYREEAGGDALSLSDFLVPTVLRISCSSGTKEEEELEVDSREREGVNGGNKNIHHSHTHITHPYRVVVKPQGVATLNGKCALKAHNGLAYAYTISQAGERGVLSTVQFPSSELILMSDARASHHPSEDVGGERAKDHLGRKYFAIKRALPCHRLDLPTGGLVLCSENREAETYFKHLFAMHKVQKRYRALCHGHLDAPDADSAGANGATSSTSSSNSSLRYITERIDGKLCTTAYRIVSVTPSARHGWITTVDLYPITGRRHQLRKHLRNKGCPIIGDKRYGHSNTWPMTTGQCHMATATASSSAYSHLFLWALEMRFMDPNHLHNKSIGKTNKILESDGDVDNTGDGSANASVNVDHLEQQLKCQMQPLWALNSHSQHYPHSEAESACATVGSDGVVWVCLAEPAVYESYRISEAAAASLTAAPTTTTTLSS